MLNCGSTQCRECWEKILYKNKAYNVSCGICKNKSLYKSINDFAINKRITRKLKSNKLIKIENKKIDKLILDNEKLDTNFNDFNYDLSEELE